MYEVDKLDSNTPAGSLVKYYLHNEDKAGDVEEYWHYNDITHYGDLDKLAKSSIGPDIFKLNLNARNPIPNK